MGIKDRIMRRGNKHHPVLPYWERRRNGLISRLRSPMENVFGTLKRSYGYRRVRYMGLERNATELFFKCMAYNLRRVDRILVSNRGPKCARQRLERRGAPLQQGKTGRRRDAVGRSKWLNPSQKP